MNSTRFLLKSRFPELNENEILKHEENLRLRESRLQNVFLHTKEEFRKKGNPSILDSELDKEITDNFISYNTYQKAIGKTPIKEKRHLFGLGGNIPNDYDEIIEHIQIVKICCQDIFDIDLEPREAGTLAIHHGLFNIYEMINNRSQRDLDIDANTMAIQFEETLARYKRTIQIISNTFTVSKTQINNSIETIKSLGGKIPLELEMAQDIHNSYHKNQKREAFKLAINHYFPEISNKKIIEKIYSKAFEKHSSE